MKKGYTHIAVVLDRSGSMESIRTDTIGGFNAFLDGQKKEPGEATVTLAQFDHEYETVHDMRWIMHVPQLTEETYRPRGTTALLDAIGRTIVQVGERISAEPEEERPEKVVFVVLTDGLENASREYKKARIAEMVKHQTDVYKWQFVFLGANMDAIAEGGSLGVAQAASMTYDPSKVRAAFGVTGQCISSYRSGVSDNVAYSDEDRSKLAKE